MERKGKEIGQAGPLPKEHKSLCSKTSYSADTDSLFINSVPPT